eukprot:7777923-Pyramimonas_sp.AAC.1
MPLLGFVEAAGDGGAGPLDAGRSAGVGSDEQAGQSFTTIANVAKSPMSANSLDLHFCLNGFRTFVGGDIERRKKTIAPKCTESAPFLPVAESTVESLGARFCHDSSTADLERVALGGADGVEDDVALVDACGGGPVGKALLELGLVELLRAAAPKSRWVGIAVPRAEAVK